MRVERVHQLSHDENEFKVVMERGFCGEHTSNTALHASCMHRILSKLADTVFGLFQQWKFFHLTKKYNRALCYTTHSSSELIVVSPSPWKLLPEKKALKDGNFH